MLLFNYEGLWQQKDKIRGDKNACELKGGTAKIELHLKQEF